MKTQFQRIEETFLAALACSSPEERAATLDRHCAGEADMRREVELLLASHVASQDFLLRPVTEFLEIDADAPTTAGMATKWLGGEPQFDTPPDTMAWMPEGLRQSPIDDSCTVAKSMFDLPHLLPPRDRTDALGRLGEYDVLAVVGRGGMGVVVKAWDARLDRVVAVKVMKPFLASDQAARERFLQEARSAAKVIHPNVVTIHAVDEVGILSYLVMEYVEGETLARRIGAGPLSTAEIVRIIRQAALGLAAAHKRGIVHRDVKPSNILLVNDDHLVKLTDFGLARAVAGDGLTQSGMIIGTPQYMSPEQALGEPVDPRSDLFSLGSVMYVMCTGAPAFQAESVVGIMRKVSDRPHAPILTVNPQIPAWLVEIIDRLLAKRPEDRIQSAVELATLLETGWARMERELAHAAVLAMPPAATTTAHQSSPGPTRRRGRERAWTAVLCLAAGLVIGLAVFLIRATDGEYELQTDDPAISAKLEEQGGITVEDRKTGRSYTLRRGKNRLPTGKYDLVVSTPDGLELETPRFQIKRWGQPVATAVLRSVPVAAEPKARVAVGNSILVHDSAESRLSPTALLTSTDWEWTRPVNVGTPVNSAGYESGAHVSADGLSLLFHSIRERVGLTGPLQLWQARRQSVSEPFTEAERLSDVINGEFTTVDPTMTADGLVLVFGSDRTAGFGAADLWMSTRSHLDAPWQPPTNLEAGVNSAFSEWEPEISSDGLSLLFHSDRPEGNGGTDLWICRRASRDEAFGAAVNLGSAVNSADSEGGAALSSDGLTLVFHRVASGEVTLWQSVRPSAEAPFGEAQPLLLSDFTDGTATGPALSPNGTELYFTMVRSEGLGGPDLWVSRRMKKSQTPSQPDSSDYSLKLDKESHVVIASLPLDPKSPHTLEAFVTFQGNPDGQNKHVFGWWGPNSLFLRDVDSRWAFGIAREGHFQAIATPKPATKGQRVHLALVRTGQEMKLFLDGRPVAAVLELSVPMLSMVAPFMISTDRENHEFVGVVDELRISKVARYHDDFTPQQRFEADAETLGLYHCDEGQGDVLQDSSGNEHHGRIIAARWVRPNDGSP